MLLLSNTWWIVWQLPLLGGMLVCFYDTSQLFGRYSEIVTVCFLFAMLVYVDTLVCPTYVLSPCRAA